MGSRPDLSYMWHDRGGYDSPRTIDYCPLGFNVVLHPFWSPQILCADPRTIVYGLQIRHGGATEPRLRLTKQVGKLSINLLAYFMGDAGWWGIPQLPWALPVSTSARSNATAIAALRGKADRHAARVLPLVAAICGEGITTHAGIARELNARRVQAPRRGKWTSTSVRNLLVRALSPPDPVGAQTAVRSAARPTRTANWR